MSVISSRFRRLLAAAGIGVLWATAAAGQDIGTDTEARHAFMMDDTTGAVLLSKAADELMPPSSMSKLMTAYMVFEKLSRGELKLTDTFRVSEKAWRQGGSKMFVQIDTEVSVGDLLHGVIVQSGNDACIVLAEGLAGSEDVFAERMTERARELGLTRSVFRNSTGWPDPEHVMTARELAILAKHIIDEFPQYYGYYSEQTFTYNGIRQGNRNPLLYKNVGADGLKTGHTEAAGYGLTASAKRGDRRLILVVNGLESVNQRSREAERLLDWGFREFDNYVLFKAGDRVEDAEVWLGVSPKVPLVAEQDMVVTLPKASRRDLKVTVVYDGPIAAPVQRGTPVARMVISAPSLETREIPLLAGADVERLGFVGRATAAAAQLIWGSVTR